MSDNNSTQKSPGTSAALSDPKELAALQSRVSSTFGATQPSADSSNKIDQMSTPGKSKSADSPSKSGDAADALGDWFELTGLSGKLRGRVAALRKLQKDALEIEADFYQAVYNLERQYAEKYTDLNKRRLDLIKGEVDPTPEEAAWTAPNDPKKKEGEAAANESSEDSSQLADKIKEKVIIEGEGEKNDSKKGIAEFWLRIFRNVPMLAEMIQPHDESILSTLDDVRVILHPAENPGFTLEFVFSENDYFTDHILTKEYTMRLNVHNEEPLTYEGPEIIACKGCTINWKKGKNVTQKVIKKVQKHKKAHLRRTITKEVKQDSFFNFFDPPKCPDADTNQAEHDEDLEDLLAADFEIGHFIRERVVPRAALYFTGEMFDDDGGAYSEGDEDEEDDEGDGDLDDDEEADDDEPSHSPPAHSHSRRGPKH